MAILIIFLAAFLHYGKSKYFPLVWEGTVAPFRKHRSPARLAGYALSLAGLVLLIKDWGGTTGTIYWVMVVMMAYSLITVSLPMIAKLTHDAR